MAARDWGIFEISRRRTDDWQFTIYEIDAATGITLSATDEVRFKLFETDGTVALDIDSIGATANGSIVTISDLGPPAVVIVRFGQDDSAALALVDHCGELLVVDDSETNPANAIKLAAYGLVKVLKSGSGDVGLT